MGIFAATQNEFVLFPVLSYPTSISLRWPIRRSKYLQVHFGEVGRDALTRNEVTINFLLSNFTGPMKIYCHRLIGAGRTGWRTWPVFHASCSRLVPLFPRTNTHATGSLFSVPTKSKHTSPDHYRFPKEGSFCSSYIVLESSQVNSESDRFGECGEQELKQDKGEPNLVCLVGLLGNADRLIFVWFRYRRVKSTETILQKTVRLSSMWERSHFAWTEINHNLSIIWIRLPRKYQSLISNKMWSAPGT